MAQFNLFPAAFETETPGDRRSRRTPVGYRNGPAFLGDFLRDGQNQVLDSDGIQSWKAWCYNCLMTERYSRLAYGSDFGICITKAMKAQSRAEAESILAREITEALMADPYGRTAYIVDIVFDWSAPDAVETQVTVRGMDDVTIDVTAYLTKGDF